MSITSSQRLDQQAHAALSKAFGAQSPTFASQAFADWLSHLATSPGKLMDLWQLGARQAQDLALQTVNPTGAGAPSAPDRRFSAPEWQRWPFNLIQHSYRATEAWWQAAATDVRGVDPHHADWVRFALQHAIDAASPANQLLTNPVVLARTAQEGGANLARGAQLALNDAALLARQQPPADARAFRVGQDVAATPGHVVLRTPLMELIQYTSTTAKVHPEPVLIVPAWIMKYYVLDLSPHNSLIKYLVDQGHTVFCISWKNPGVAERDCAMQDYLRQGLLAALDAIAAIAPKRQVHAAGYCLGGTLLAIGAAALARDAAVRGDDAADSPTDSPFASLTLLAAQTDFSEPGGLSLYIDANQINLLDAQMAETGYLTGEQMAVAFQWLHAVDLLWTPAVNRYLLGEPAPLNDLMAWNADITRMPARMHSDYLRQLFLGNALSAGHYTVPPVAGPEAGNADAPARPVALCDIRAPIFMVGTESDHVAPWRSVYKLHLFSPAEITFVLTNGGHNAGIVSEPGHARRHYRQSTRPFLGRYVGPDEWQQTAPQHEGSWWTAWHDWLAARSGKPVNPPPMGRAPDYAPLHDAPGQYVLER